MTVTTSETTTDAPADIETQVGALAERLFFGGIGALEALTIELGSRLGLYKLLYEQGPSTVADIARGAGIHPRYAQEWLEQQAIAELIVVDDVTRAADERRYSISDAQAAVLVDETSLAYLEPIGRFLVSFVSAIPKVVDAYRSGGGVSFGEYGTEMREAQAAFNRPAFQSLLASDWLANGTPDVHERLATGDDVKVLDVGCGVGWSTIALAQAYPRATFVGVDADVPSIEQARVNAKEAGLDDRVSFIAGDAADAGFLHQFDAVFVLEALHDLSRPVDVLRAVRAACTDGGTVIIMDERVADAFGAIGDPVERFMYGASVLHCLPAGMAEQPSAGTGTVMRVDTLREYAGNAGFRSVDVLPIEHDFFRFYRLQP
jgi:SAM-dependent methyltransferase